LKPTDFEPHPQGGIYAGAGTDSNGKERAKKASRDEQLLQKERSVKFSLKDIQVERKVGVNESGAQTRKETRRRTFFGNKNSDVGREERERTPEKVYG